MHGASVAVIVSARKVLTNVRARWILGGLLALVVGAVCLLYRHERSIEFGSQRLSIEYASTEAARQRGLSGRADLARDHAMLFVFDRADEYCFWMKDMRFSLDIIWLDDNKRVVSIRDTVRPETYPQNFCPDKPARYVVEVNAGVARAARLHEGDTVKF